MSKYADSLAIIIPSFNCGKYLKDLFNSIYGGDTCLGFMQPQTLLPTEIIVCDDASTDNTLEILEQARKEHPEISYVAKSQNRGTSAACNRAISMTKCEFITRMDADDMRESWSLERMMNAQLNNLHSMIYDNTMIFVNGQRQGKEWIMGEYNFDRLLEVNLMHAGIMYPIKAWEECGGYVESFTEGRDDWSFNVALGVAGYCGVHVPGAGYLYRRDQQNRSLRNSSSEYQQKFYLQMREHFKDIYEGRRPAMCCGNRKDNPMIKNLPSQNTSTLSLVGSEGMTLVEYLGANVGKEPFYGPATGVAYVFSTKLNVRNVDNRDVHYKNNTGLLDLQEHGSMIFRAYPVPATSAPSTPTVPERDSVTLTESQPAVELTVSEGTPIKPGDVTGVTKALIQKLALAGITTWEEFVATQISSLMVILGKTSEVVENIKKQVTE